MSSELLLSGGLGCTAMDPNNSGYRFMSKPGVSLRGSKAARVFAEASKFDSFVSSGDLGLEFLQELPQYDYSQRITLETVFRGSQIEQMQKFLQLSRSEQLENVLNSYPAYMALKTQLQKEAFTALLPPSVEQYDGKDDETLREYLQRRQYVRNSQGKASKDEESSRQRREGDLAAVRAAALERTALQFHEAILKSVFTRKKAFHASQAKAIQSESNATAECNQKKIQLLHARLLRRLEYQESVSQGKAGAGGNSELSKMLNGYRRQCAVQSATLQQVRQSGEEYRRRRADLDGLLLDLEAAFQLGDARVNAYKADVNALQDAVPGGAYGDFKGTNVTLSFKKHERTEDVAQCLRNWDAEEWD